MDRTMEYFDKAIVALQERASDTTGGRVGRTSDGRTKND